MSETANDGGTSEEKPVLCKVEPDDAKFPPIPEPDSDDFDEEISEEERNYYRKKFADLNEIKNMRLHCTACDRHLGCSPNAEERMRTHPMLRTLVCHSCYTFYNSGEFEKGDDGSELYCRWCGQGGQVYCCAECPHVFCAKCIKRNLGTPKIKEIESTDDWKCFKCNFHCLWDLRAICWGVLRYCAVRRMMANNSSELKEKYAKSLSKDESICCLHKIKRKEKLEAKKKEAKEKEIEAKVAAHVVSKIPPTIQVKKFASINMEPEQKKAQKRSISPKAKTTYALKNAIQIAPLPKMLTPTSMPPNKKIRLASAPVMNNSIRFVNSDLRKAPGFQRIRPKPVQNTYNGYTANIFNSIGNMSNISNISNMSNDNINLSLDSLTLGLDMSAVAAMAQDNDVVCTPDFPLEPLCEVTEDNDDDVECITPAPVAIPKMLNPPPLVPRAPCTNLNDISSENIVQMTENDVTVNEATGGLKFRVDPQTLSSRKMYRLPDGRIFAINVNPNMPGGYSATIVAVAEASGKPTAKGATYAAKLSAVSSSTVQKRKQSGNKPKQAVKKVYKNTKLSTESPRQCDFNVPVEWYRYNLIDSVDALEYPLARLNKLKKEATSIHLRSRTLEEMKKLHTTLDRLLNTSITRFTEIRANLNKGYKQYVNKKSRDNHISDEEDDDDDVEILPDLEEDPIFIDENSNDSNINGEVDLTGAGSSEHNASTESVDKNASDLLNIPVTNENGEDAPSDTISTIKDVVEQDKDGKIGESEKDSRDKELISQENGSNTNTEKETEDVTESNDPENGSKLNGEDSNSNEKDLDAKDSNINTNYKSEKTEEKDSKDPDVSKSPNSDKMDVTNGETNEETNEEVIIPDKDKTVDTILDGIINKADNEDIDDATLQKEEDTEISEEMIENLLKDDSRGDAATNSNSLDVSEVLGEA